MHFFTALAAKFGAGFVGLLMAAHVLAPHTPLAASTTPRVSPASAPAGETKQGESPEKKAWYQNIHFGVGNAGNMNPYLNVPCDPKAPVAFTHDVTDYTLIAAVEPPITTPGNSRHRAWLDIDTSKAAKVPVYAPADGTLVEGVYKNVRGAIDYDLHIQISCRYWYLINHLTYPVDAIKAAYPASPQIDNTRIDGPLPRSVPVKAGELLGYTSGTPVAHNFDFGVFDLEHVNPGLPADPGSNYGKEKNFICPFDLLPDALKKAYYAKIVASDKPYTNCVSY